MDYSHIVHAMKCMLVPFGLQKSPLYVAAEEGHAEIISILIEAGADLEAKADLNVSGHGLWWVIYSACGEALRMS